MWFPEVQKGLKTPRIPPQPMRYETEVREIRSLGLLETVRSEIEDQVRQWLLPGDWKDNVYKAKLRTQATIRAFHSPKTE